MVFYDKNREINKLKILNNTSNANSKLNCQMSLCNLGINGTQLLKNKNTNVVTQHTLHEAITGCVLF